MLNFTSVPSCLEKIAPIKFVLSPKIHSIRNQKDNASSPFPVRQLVTSCLHIGKDAHALILLTTIINNSKPMASLYLVNSSCASKLYTSDIRWLLIPNVYFCKLTGLVLRASRRSTAFRLRRRTTGERSSHILQSTWTPRPSALRRSILAGIPWHYRPRSTS